MLCRDCFAGERGLRRQMGGSPPGWQSRVPFARRGVGRPQGEDASKRMQQFVPVYDVV